MPEPAIAAKGGVDTYGLPFVRVSIPPFVLLVRVSAEGQVSPAFYRAGLNDLDEVVAKQVPAWMQVALATAAGEVVGGMVIGQLIAAAAEVPEAWAEAPETTFGAAAERLREGCRALVLQTRAGEGGR